MGIETGIYVHIPFCKKKCLYCDFLSLAGREDLHEPYKETLLKEIRQAALHERKISTIYIGGGTPTALPSLFLSEILDALGEYKNIEITVELNPGLVDDRCFAMMRERGVNRLSIGTQAFQNNLLNKIGRIHSAEDFMRSYTSAKHAGFTNISIDLMFSLPGQSMKDWLSTLKQAVALEPTHISAYSLTIEDETPFGRMYREGLLSLPSDELDREMYHEAVNFLTSQGYHHYEISNFGIEGYYSRHNINYWARGEYLGLGLGAHSFINGVRYHNTYDMEKYLSSRGEGELIAEDETEISTADAMSETMFLGLRMMNGVCLAEFREQFGVDIFSVYGEAINKMIVQGLLKLHDGRISLTQLGMDLSNRAFLEFI